MLSETPATKGDIQGLRDELRTYYATKADVESLRSDVKADLTSAATDTNRRIDRLFWAVNCSGR